MANHRLAEVTERARAPWLLHELGLRVLAQLAVRPTPHAGLDELAAAGGRAAEQLTVDHTRHAGTVLVGAALVAVFLRCTIPLLQPAAAHGQNRVPGQPSTGLLRPLAAPGWPRRRPGPAVTGATPCAIRIRLDALWQNSPRIGTAIGFR